MALLLVPAGAHAATTCLCKPGASPDSCLGSLQTTGVLTQAFGLTPPPHPQVLRSAPPEL